MIEPNATLKHFQAQPTPLRQRPHMSPDHETLMASLRAHDTARRRDLDGVTDAALQHDAGAWIALGGAIGDLALAIGGACARSALCSSRPDAARLAAQIAEAVDDQVDALAWAVIAAAASVKVAERTLNGS